MAVDLDPPVVRVALLRWSADESRWLVVEAYRASAGASLRSTLNGRSRPGDRVIEVMGRRGSVEAAAAALAAPVQPGAVWRQPRLL